MKISLLAGFGAFLCMVCSALVGEGYFEFRPALFLPASHQTQQVLGYTLYESQLEGGYWSYPDWTVWGNVSYARQRGQREHSDHHFNLTFTTMSAGASYHFPLYLKFRGWNGYLGAGPLVGRVKGCSRLRSTLGGVVKFGSFYKFHDWGHLNVFCDYNQLVFQFKKLDHSSTNNNLTMSGFKVGIAFAAEF